VGEGERERVHEVAVDASNRVFEREKEKVIVIELK